MRQVFKQQITLIIIVTSICLFTFIGLSLRPTHAAPANGTVTNTPVVRLRAPRALTPTATGIPTTSNPTINTAIGAGRIFSNPSFENTDSTCVTANGSWSYIRQEHMRGWYTAHPVVQERCNSGGFGISARVIELNRIDGQVPDGTWFASLNADVASFLYQPICVANNDVISFEFYHNGGGSNRTDIASLRFGIPSGLPAGSVAADSYNREVIRASTTIDSNVHATNASATTPSGSSNITARLVNGWGVYSGTHTLPSSGWNGIRNVGFFGIQSICPGCGNLLDKITLGIAPFIDMGTSRDRIAIEGSSPTAINIRINGRVTANTKIALRRNPLNPGPATSDSDFTVGTISAGAFGNTTFTHTAGSDVWLISVPAGDYDGGIVPANNVGGLTVPLNFIYDQVSESTEWAYFELAPPTKEGSSPYFDSNYNVTGGNWDLVDPTCDNSFKNGVVYSITDLGPTPTPTNTPTKTFTSSPTFTKTPTKTATNTPTATKTNTLTYTNTPTNTYTNTNTKTNTPTNTPTKTPTNTNTHTYTPTNTYTPTITDTPTITLTDTPTETDTPTPSFTNTVTPSYTPTASNTRTNTPTNGPFAQIKAAIGDLYVVSLMQNGTLASWGQNERGVQQSTIPPQYANLLFVDVATSIGNAYLLDENGNLYTWGENLYGEGDIPINAQTNIRAIGAGARFALALRTDGTVVAWGRNLQGQINVPPGLTDVVAIDGGDRHSVALRGDGTVVAWGDNTASQTSVPPGLSNVVAVSAGENHTLALLSNGRVVGWGSNSKGQIKIPATATDIVKIAAGRECSLAIKADGTLITWGNPMYVNFPAAAYSGGAVSVDAANQNSVVGLRDGRIFVAGVNYADVMTSRTTTNTPLITQTPSATRQRTATFTPLNTRTDTATATNTFTPTASRTGTNTRTKTPSRTKMPTRMRTFTPTP